MILLHISSVKECMAKLLLSEAFDPFEFIEGEITSFATFRFDGYLKKDFFDSDELETIGNREHALWKDVREFCFSLIKGRKTPLGFKFVFGLSRPNIEKLLSQQGLSFTSSDVDGLYINLRYDGQRLQCVTGTSMRTFTLDKSLEQAWDTMVQKFFVQKEIEVELE